MAYAGTQFEPAKYMRSMDASIVSRPQGSPDKRGIWKSKDQYNECLNLNSEGRVPGYTGHAPGFKFQGSIGLPYAKACQNGSQHAYVHEEPNHTGGGRFCDQPISGYSGYMPFVQTQGGNKNYEHNVATSMQYRKIDPLELRIKMDKTNAVYTPSMNKVTLPFSPARSGVGARGGGGL